MTLSYRDAPGAGPPILLLHGLSSNALIWDGVVACLAGRHRVVALDQRGHGSSDKPDDGYDFETIAADARHVIETLGLGRPLIVGHSWGGNVALEISATGGPSRGLVLVDGGFIELSRRMSWDEARERLRPPDIDMPLESFRARLRERLGARWSPAWERATMGNFHIDADGIVRRNLSIANHMRILEHLYRHRPSALFPRAEGGVTTIVAMAEGTGAEDERLTATRTILNEAASWLGDRLEVHWMADTVHDVPLQRPEALAEIIADAASRSQ